MKHNRDVWILSLIYWLTHLIGLVKLPVFADEAIYIRWAQLIQDDAARYAFFSMADGKPPLFMWLLSLVVHPAWDPLFMARLLSVAVGFAQMLLAMMIIRVFTQSRRAMLIAGIAFTVVPYWYFLHRMALMDGLLTLCISIAFFATLQITQRMLSSAKKFQLPSVAYLILLSVSFAAAMMTKTPALFALPVFLAVPSALWVTAPKREIRHYVWICMFIGLALLAGLLIFFSLRISPLFGALFARSSDFTFSLLDLVNGEWNHVLFRSLPREMSWIFWYCTPTLMLAAIAGMLLPARRKQIGLFILAGILFAIPLIVLGRVLWPRYFLPSAFFFTLAGALSLDVLFGKKAFQFAALSLGAGTLLFSGYFMWMTWTNLSRIPFVLADESQYLTEWSAGFGNTEVRDFVITRQDALMGTGKKVVILTEGSFGTLPDGLLMYFRREDQIRGLELEGIGVSIQEIPSTYRERASVDEVYYVSNSHRFRIQDPQSVEKIASFPRPHDGPTLDIYKVLP